VAKLSVQLPADSELTVKVAPLLLSVGADTSTNLLAEVPQLSDSVMALSEGPVISFTVAV
jgi:hypothetical protein